MEERMEDSISDFFTKKGLQHLIDRAHLRHFMAEMEGDEEEVAMTFGEILAFCQLSEAYGWEVIQGKIQGDEDA